MKLSKNVLLAGAIAVLMGAPLAANATSFTFDSTGAGINNGRLATGLDEAPGNAYADGGGTAIAARLALGNNAPNTPDTAFTLYYQANLNSVTRGSTNVFSVSDETAHFTAIAGFGETVTKANLASATDKASASFDFDSSNKTNYFRLYANTANGNDLTGNGFITSQAILTGKIISASTSTFTIDSTAPVDLDQAGDATVAPVNNYPGITTVTGRDGTDFQVQITDFNALYFTSGLKIGDLITSAFTTNSTDPFTFVDPTSCINTLASSCDTLGGGIKTQGITGIGNVNGQGRSFLLQADASQTFTDVAVERPVPEPATTAILGLGLAMLAFFGVSRKKNQA